MTTRLTLLLAMFVACIGAVVSVWAQAGGDAARGRLIYETHCLSCHTVEIHWRDGRLATNWSGLEAQVRRWQVNAGLRWSAGEIDDVVRYLNSTIYHFPNQAPRQTG